MSHCFEQNSQFHTCQGICRETSGQRKIIGGTNSTLGRIEERHIDFYLSSNSLTLKCLFESTTICMVDIMVF